MGPFGGPLILAAAAGAAERAPAGPYLPPCTTTPPLQTTTTIASVVVASSLAAGQFKDKATIGDPCSNGRYGLVIQDNTNGDFKLCPLCPAGTYSDAGYGCTRCAGGTSSDIVGADASTDCAACTDGTYAAEGELASTARLGNCLGAFLLVADEVTPGGLLPCAAQAAPTACLAAQTPTPTPTPPTRASALTGEGPALCCDSF